MISISVVILLVAVSVITSFDYGRMKWFSKVLSRLQSNTKIVLWITGSSTGTKTSSILSQDRKRKNKTTLASTIDLTTGLTASQRIQSVKSLVDCHETASLLTDLIHTDGAGAWPPLANHVSSTWPAALQPYKDIYQSLVHLLAVEKASLDDGHNLARINSYRSQFRQMLEEQVNLKEVQQLLEAADAGRWDVFPRATFNAFYSCVANCRHAYR